MSKKHAKKACYYCKGGPEPGWIETGNNGPIVSCPICNPRGDEDRRAVNSYDEMLAVLVAAEELINERSNPAPDYGFRAVLHKRLEEAAVKARARIGETSP